MPLKRARNGRRIANKRNGVVSLANMPSHNICRSIAGTLALTAADQGFVYQVDPTAGGDFSELAAVFDQYRVTRVDFTWVLSRNDTAELPTLVYSPDFNDASVPATSQAVLNYETAKVVQFSEHRRQHTFSFAPKGRIAVATAGAGGGVSDVALAGNMWCHTGQSIQWLGLKYFLVGYNSTANPQAIVQTYVKIHYQFKNSR